MTPREVLGDSPVQTQPQNTAGVVPVRRQGSVSMDLDVCKQSIRGDICCLELPCTSAGRHVWPQGTSVHGNQPQVAPHQVNKSPPRALFPIPSVIIPFPLPPHEAPASNESQAAQPTATQHLPPRLCAARDDTREGTRMHIHTLGAPEGKDAFIPENNLGWEGANLVGKEPEPRTSSLSHMAALRGID